MTKIITATFKDRFAAETALSQLEAVGITESQVSLLVSDDVRGRHFGLKEGSKVDEGVAAGATFGGLVGAVLGSVAAASVIVIPGLNLVVSGALAASLAGLGAGATAGGLVGGLIGAGIPEHEAKLYEKEVARGSVLIAVEAVDNDQKAVIKDILKRTEGFNIAA